MKKGRAGVRLSLTVSGERLKDLAGLVFLETSTFGVRVRKEERRVLRREVRTVETAYGSVRIKDGFDDKGRLLKTHIEFEDVRRIADEKGLPYRKVLEDIKKILSL